MSWRRLADAVIDAAPAGAFVGSVAGDEVEPGKPHPAPYLAAAIALGVEPADCIAIEDSPTGTRSALSAGCRTVGIPHVVALEPHPGLTILPTLQDVRLDELIELVTNGSGA
jgi:beta-phosphoglucomutase-like phosphatase (HAD superfamily)